MNLTNVEHFKKYYPEEEISGFDTFYFMQGGDDAFAFILVKGEMENVRVFTSGNYDEDSLEKRLFSLVSKYGRKYAERESIFDEADSIKDKECGEIREELMSPKRGNMSDTMWSLICIGVLSSIELVVILISYLINVQLMYLAYMAVGCICSNIILFIALKSHTPKNKEVERW